MWEAVSLTNPVNSPGRSSSCRSQSAARPSNSVAAGDVLQIIAFALTAAASNSARMAGEEAVFAKYARKPG